ncbi:uncharacterized protein LOC104906811 [Beta vulgaris subsp. vulgaris]|uniref:uncharacterized protein LOC104906811 n=1 Tax=Beta vulgaris subsp. vulgaris TaxID=3555 RepID=UPI0005403260|nr:uncharacterized protein LOC104906811 [Beta vulgaris subsp. vulgaris]
MEWKVDVIEATYNDRDTRCILDTPLSHYELQDELTWALTKDGHYYVRTAYMLGKGSNLDHFHQAWGDIWGMEISPKVRHFFRRFCTYSLPVRALLKRRNMIKSDLCPWGCGVSETPIHAIFSCPQWIDLWRGSGCEALCCVDDSADLCELLVSWRDIDGKLKTKGAFLAWCLWGDRNNMVFNQKSTPHKVLLDRADRCAAEYGQFPGRIYSHHAAAHIPSSRQWLAPPLGSCKLNVAASLLVDGWVGLGVVARESNSVVCFTATRRVRAHWTLELAEAKAITMGIHLGKRFGLQDVVLESDCQVDINRLAKNVSNLFDLDVFLYDIFSSCSSLSSIVWSHVKRDGNFVAHHLAKIIPFGDEQIWENHVPSEVEPYILMDKLSLD